MIHLTEEERNKLKNAIVEYSNALTRIEAEKDFIKELVNNLHEQYDIDKKIINTIAKTYHKQQFNQLKEEHTTLEMLYETILGSQNDEHF